MMRQKHYLMKLLKKDLDKKDLTVLEYFFRQKLKYGKILNEIRNKEYINRNDIMMLQIMLKYSLISIDEYQKLTNKSIVKQLLMLAGYERPTGLEQILPYKKDFPILKRIKAEKLMNILYNGELLSWW